MHNIGCYCSPVYMYFMWCINSKASSGWNHWRSADVCHLFWCWKWDPFWRYHLWRLQSKITRTLTIWSWINSDYVNTCTAMKHKCTYTVRSFVLCGKVSSLLWTPELRPFWIGPMRKSRERKGVDRCVWCARYVGWRRESRLEQLVRYF